MPKIFAPPGDLGVRLRETFRSIERAFSDRRDTPVKLQQFATADLPSAADYVHSIVADTDTDNLAFSDGSAWIYPLKATSVSAFGLTLIDDADAVTARATLGLVIGTNVQAYSATLAAIVALNTAPYGRGLLEVADAAALRTYGGLAALAGANTFTAGQTIQYAAGTTAPLRIRNTDGTPSIGIVGDGGAQYGTIGLSTASGSANFRISADNMLEMQSGGSTIATISSSGSAVVGSMRPSSYTVATVPSAATHGAGAIIYVSNESGGATPAFSDGTNWRRDSDRAIIS